MANINERFIEAAKAGSELCLKALLCDPGCDALSTDTMGWTALMWAAYYGHEACVRILLPVSAVLKENNIGSTALTLAARHGHEGCVGLLLPMSGALAKARNGITASMWARKMSHESLAQGIEAYDLAQSEKNDMMVSVPPGAPAGHVAIRL